MDRLLIVLFWPSLCNTSSTNEVTLSCDNQNPPSEIQIERPTKCVILDWELTK